jgi:hypothetical protein
MRVHPYASLPERHFWSTAVARRSFFDIGTLWEPKFPILPRMPISTFGSCFAQHMGQSLKARGFNWFIAERAPYGLSAESARKFNYGIFTARTGNIYTPSLLRQWLAWAMETEPVSDEVWECDGRFFDPFRPNIEPDGFESREEVLQSRSMTLAALRTAVTRSRVLIFTLGLTESWFHAETGVEYPMCPGTVAGVYEAEKHRFVNQDYGQVRTALLAAIHAMRARNPGLKNSAHGVSGTPYSDPVRQPCAGRDNGIQIHFEGGSGFVEKPVPVRRLLPVLRNHQCAAVSRDFFRTQST